MKKLTFAATMLGLLVFMGACMGGRNMEVTYKAQSDIFLNGSAVYLTVEDNRPHPELVGPGAREKDLFEELRGGRFDLVVDLPNGSKVTMTDLNAHEAVWEAAARRLQIMGVDVDNQPTGNRINLVIKINQFNIDLEGGDLVASVYLSAVMSRSGGGQVITTNTGSQASRIKLIGGAGGATALSDALSQTMNSLDFSPINRL